MHLDNFILYIRWTDYPFLNDRSARSSKMLYIDEKMEWAYNKTITLKKLKRMGSGLYVSTSGTGNSDGTWPLR